MSFGRIENYFTVLNRELEFRFVLPDDVRFRNNPDGTPNPHYQRPTKTLLVLNGATHNNLEWLMHTRIHDLAIQYNLAVILPSGENSFYVNTHGNRFADYVGQELMEYATKTFGLSTKKEDHYVMGLSMGGFGALHTGLAYADTFDKIAAFSSALIIHEVAGAKEGFSNGGGDYKHYVRMFGDLDNILTSDINPEQLLLDLRAAGKPIPGMYLCCGTEDFLLEHNRQFNRFLVDNNFPHLYYESPGGHDYDFWNGYVEKAIKWMLEVE